LGLKNSFALTKFHCVWVAKLGNMYYVMLVGNYQTLKTTDLKHHFWNKVTILDQQFLLVIPIVVTVLLRVLYNFCFILFYRWHHQTWRSCLVQIWSGHAIEASLWPTSHPSTSSRSTCCPDSISFLRKTSGFWFRRFLVSLRFFNMGNDSWKKVHSVMSETGREYNVFFGFSILL